MKYPTTLQIYLDSVCNFKCRTCLYQNRKDIPASFDFDNLKKLKHFIQNAKTISISACGEPLLSPNFERTLEYIYSLNNHSNLIAIVTNGSLLSGATYKLLEGHLADLTISFNGTTPETYESEMVGGLLDQTMAQIQDFMEAVNHDRNKVGLHFVANSENYKEIPRLNEVSRYLGIGRVRVDQIMVADSKQFCLALWNVSGKYKKIVESNPCITFGTEIKNTCTSPFNEFHVWADGRVAPCCYNGSMFMGNAYLTSPEDVWNGLVYSNLRKHPAKQCFTCPKIGNIKDLDYHIYPYLREGLY